DTLNVLFGDYNPAGRLPVTFYRSVRDLPPFTDYSMQGRTYRYFKGKPLYPFGFGLSYTKFEYSDLRLNKSTVNPLDTLRVSVDVRNVGKRDGDEVVQLYVRNLMYKGPKPIKSLDGFDRVNVKKGETKTVTLLVPVRSFKLFSVKKNEYEVYPGRYQLQIGSSSEDIKLTRTVRVVN
ncbi:MAG: fibronectin type III-like domain-contianing protein, partial [Bacteroidetes bacterium]|nr:fibronectin type III-like domain-contianing protein [Bacteroidota bacterium]